MKINNLLLETLVAVALITAVTGIFIIPALRNPKSSPGKVSLIPKDDLMEKHLVTIKNDPNYYRVYCLNRGNRVFEYTFDVKELKFQDTFIIHSLTGKQIASISTHSPCVSIQL